MLICEIGNNHFGDLFTAKAMIRVAKECGADAVKAQAFVADDLKSKGSMDASFYESVAFEFEEYFEMIALGEELGIPVFFSIFSNSFKVLEQHQIYKKIAGNQYRDANIKEYDVHNSFVSIPSDAPLKQMKHATPLHVSKYLARDPELHRIKEIQEYSIKRVGYSDHCVGLAACKEAINDYGVETIEKHFTLIKNKKYKDTVFRDTVHGSTPKEFYQLARLLKG